MTETKIREETVPEPSKVKKGGFGEMMGILLPMEHESQPKSNVSEPHSDTETQCVEESSMTLKPNGRKPSVSAHTIDAGRKPSVSARRSDAGRKPSMSVQDLAAKPKCSPKPIAIDLSSVAGPKPDRKPSFSRKPVTYRKPSVSSAPSGESKPQCARKPCISIPNSPTEPKCETNDVRNYENIGICLLPKPGQNEEPEVKPNAAYRCLQIPNSPQPSSEYAVPQRLQEQQRERNAQRPSENRLLRLML